MKTIALWQYSFNSHLIAQQVVDNTGIVPKVGMTFESEVKNNTLFVLREYVPTPLSLIPQPIGNLPLSNPTIDRFESV
jgi:hypothetical protein